MPQYRDIIGSPSGGVPIRIIGGDLLIPSNSLLINSGNITVTGNITVNGLNVATELNNKLPLSGGTMTGPLKIAQSSNTAALLLEGTTGGWASGLKLNNTTATTGKNYGIYSNSSGYLVISDESLAQSRVTISPSGDATFRNSIYVNNLINITGNGFNMALGVNDLVFTRSGGASYIKNNASGGSIQFLVTDSQHIALTLGADKSTKTFTNTVDDGLGNANITGKLTVSYGSEVLALKGRTVDHVYMTFFPRSGNTNLRGGWIGYGSNGTTQMQIVSELGQLLLTGSGGVKTPNNTIDDGSGNSIFAAKMFVPHIYLKNNFTDNVNGTTWYGLGTTNVASDGAAGNFYGQLAYYYGLILKTANNELKMKSTADNSGLTFNNNVVYHAGNFSTGNILFNNFVNQSVQGSLSIAGNGNLYVGNGTASTYGSIGVRNGTAYAIQLDGGSGKLTGVKAYIDNNGNAQFSGNVTVNSFSTNSTALVTNLNAESLNGVKEAALAKNQSIYELAGAGVSTGSNVTQQPVPNMSVIVAAGSIYTDSGRRMVFANSNVSLTTSSTTYDRIDVVYVQPASTGANEGTFAVAAGTPAAVPVEPSIPAGAVKIATISVKKNVGSIINTDITDAREWRSLVCNPATRELFISSTAKFKTDRLFSNGSTSIYVDEPFRANGWATTLTIPSGNTSVTWTHNLGIGTSYAIQLTSNSPNRHVYWGSKATNSVIIYIDDPTDVNTLVDAVITAY